MGHKATLGLRHTAMAETVVIDATWARRFSRSQPNLVALGLKLAC